MTSEKGENNIFLPEDLVSEWIDSVDIRGITRGSSRKVRWRCLTCTNEWSAIVKSRVNGRGCPACANQRVHSDGRNSMASTHPELAEELLPNPHGEPDSLMAGTNKKLPWKCKKCEHEWVQKGSNRLVNGCPACANRVVHSDGRNSMVSTHPELAKELLPNSHGDASTLIAGTHKKLPWECSKCKNRWLATGSSRRSGRGCPVCAGRAVHPDGRNSLKKLKPELVSEWHFENKIEPHQVTLGSYTRVKWICKTCDHLWETRVKTRGVQERGCPACAKKTVHSDGRNSLLTLHPLISAELNEKSILASDLTSKSNKVLEWKCQKCQHCWTASVNNRITKKSGCPACAGSVPHMDGRNSMAKTHPDLAKQLLPNKFGSSETLLAGTQRKLPWECTKCSHKWEATGAHRLKNNCPACSNRQIHIDGRNSMATTHPKLAQELLPNPYGTAENLIASTSEKLPWRCKSCGNEWETTGGHRVHGKTNCPSCANHGFDTNSPAYYYSLRLEGPESTWWYKGGITNNDVEKRILNIISSLKRNNLPLEVTIEGSVLFGLGKDAKSLEEELLDIIDIREETLEKFEGSRELFNIDPLSYARENNLLDYDLLLDE